MARTLVETIVFHQQLIGKCYLPYSRLESPAPPTTSAGAASPGPVVAIRPLVTALP